VPTNGEGELELDEGGYVIYYEAPGADEGDIPDGRAFVTSDDTGDELPLETYDSELSYDNGDHAGRAVLTFEVEEPGTYLLESDTEGDGDLAVGRSVAGKLVTTIVGSMALGGLGVIVGVVILIVTAVRRRNARARQNPWNPPPPGTPPVYGSAPPPPPTPGYPPPPPTPGYPPPAPPPAPESPRSPAPPTRPMDRPSAPPWPPPPTAPE
jgi:hypothetical protein